MFEEKVYKIHLISLFYAKLKEVEISIFHNQPREKIHRSVNRTYIYVCVCKKRIQREEETRKKKKSGRSFSRDRIKKVHIHTHR